jgi:hypothetical protein
MPAALGQKLPHRVERTDDVVHVAVVAERQAVVEGHHRRAGPFASRTLEACRIDRRAILVRDAGRALPRGPRERMMAERPVHLLDREIELGT